VVENSAQPSHSPQVDVCPFLGRESEQEDGAPVPINARDGAGDLRPSPSFRCLALSEATRIDAGRQRRLCLNMRHVSCRRYGDAENEEVVTEAEPAVGLTSAELLPDDPEDEQDARIRRIRRRYGNTGKNPDAPRARVTVAGQPVDFTPVADAAEGGGVGGGVGGSGTWEKAAEAAEARLTPRGDAVGRIPAPGPDRLGALWDEQQSTSDPANLPTSATASVHGDSSMEGANAPGTAAALETDWDGAGESATSADGWPNEAPKDDADAWDAGDDAGMESPRVFAQQAAARVDGSDPEHDLVRGERSPSEREEIKQPVGAVVSGALGGLGAGDGGDRRSRLMAIAGVALIVVGIVTAVLAVMVGLDGAADTTVPLAAADAEPDGAASGGVSPAVADADAITDAPVVVAVVAAEAETAAAEASAETTEADAGAEAPAPASDSEETATAPPPVAAGEAEAEVPVPSRTGSTPNTAATPPAGSGEAPESESTASEPSEDPAAGAEGVAAPPPAESEEAAPEEAEAAESEPVDDPASTIVLPETAARYGAVSFWPLTETYSIAGGDTIGSVAAQFDTHAYAIICLNQQYWSSSQRFFTMIGGTSLIIPVGYQIPGDAQTQSDILNVGFLPGHCG